MSSFLEQMNNRLMGKGQLTGEEKVKTLIRRIGRQFNLGEDDAQIVARWCSSIRLLYGPTPEQLMGVPKEIISAIAGITMVNSTNSLAESIGGERQEEIQIAILSDIHFYAKYICHPIIKPGEIESLLDIGNCVGTSMYS